MSDLRDRLARLGLSQYFEVLVAEGFDTWDTVLDITETDLSHLNVKLGHRRKIQRAIAEWRGQPADRALPPALGRTASAADSYRSEDSGPESKGKHGDTSTAVTSAPGTKRKYRRHPKPDEHAPERPPSAYVIFSNQVRESLKGQDLTFTEIAKVVGERWQILPAGEREACERQANSAKEKYYAELAEYKKTPQFEAYQKYLEDFRAKHAAATKEGKRSKLETETSTSTRSGSHDQHERAMNRRMSSAQSDSFATGQQRLDQSPPIGPARLPTGPSYSSKPTSPITQSLPGLQSPRPGGYYSVSASPRSAALQKENHLDMNTIDPARDLRGPMDTSLPYHPSAHYESHRQTTSTTPPSYPYQTQYQTHIDVSSRRTLRDSARLPGLSHEDTTLSSESSHSGYSYPLAAMPEQVLPVDPGRTSRMLPHPTPSIGPIKPSPSPLDRPPPARAQAQEPLQDYRTQGPLAALVIAGELASRAADSQVGEEKGFP
ncbi:uncharacterized protein K460DRAFT_405978 [Cucurbitaria berberidis CBS 394.84]|uniref:HMG box domain-containing protein n=1 Tax=Cucurbitaria berberidis CBS 394.84 TaxID=1168544 RepID=A0A9P4L8W9_9PLEO|nr:uncharacterized protein K460DRAFT_405978 [Cucurbitaria berberidis CBS 394.84]KAF1845738.1 hypothetical protein K460DRAFT_405978 [Cucurbitaria berberidis CBS 394.84]